MTKTLEYEGIPLSATETSPESRAYGIHPIPIATETSRFELPQLIAQSVDAAPTGDLWKKWGRWKRSEESVAWHFYAADMKFESILRDPFKLVNSGAGFAVEANVSSFGNDPLPVALAGLWRKRCVSRIWQEAGVNVFVDLFFDGWTRELVLDGVPKDHCLYATKFARTGNDGKPLGLKAIAADFALASSHCNKPEQLTFAVYGGGKFVKSACDMNGWLWLPTSNNRNQNS